MENKLPKALVAGRTLLLEIVARHEDQTPLTAPERAVIQSLADWANESLDRITADSAGEREYFAWRDLSAMATMLLHA